MSARRVQRRGDRCCWDVVIWFGVRFDRLDFLLKEQSQDLFRRKGICHRLACILENDFPQTF